MVETLGPAVETVPPAHVVLPKRQRPAIHDRFVGPDGDPPRHSAHGGSKVWVGVQAVVFHLVESKHDVLPTDDHCCVWGAWRRVSERVCVTVLSGVVWRPSERGVVQGFY